MEESPSEPPRAKRPSAESERYDHLHGLFEQMRGLTGRELEDRLRHECGDDAELRSELEDLLRAHADDSALFSEHELERGRAELERLLDSTEDASKGGAWIPERIGAYRVIEVLGRGGMGVVYEAEQAEPRRRVALKLIHPGQATPERTQRFRREARILGRLQHPGIAQVYESGSYDLGRGEQHYFAMEYVEGVDLRTHAEREGLDTRQRLALLATICDAVQHAHEAGIVHRDLKPDNVLVDEAGRAKVLDFGIAFTTEDSTMLSTMVTEEGRILGTLAYMSPEQLVGSSGTITVRSDVYALGVMGFELLSGELPLDPTGLPVTAGIHLISSREPRRLGSVIPRLRGDVETILGKALEKESTRRYESAEALAADIRRYLADRPIAARPPSRVYRARMFARRNKGLVATLVVLLLGVVVSTILAAFAREQTRMARELKEEVDTNLYFAEMQLVSDVADDPTSAPRMQELLAHWVPTDGEPDRRGWEWYYLNGVSRSIETVLEAPEGVLCVEWHPTRELFITGERTARVYDAERGEFIAEFESGFRAEDIAWSPDGRSVVLCGLTNVKVFETDTWNERMSWVPPSNGGVTWHPNGDHFLHVGSGGEIHRFDAGDWRAQLVHEDPVIFGGPGMLDYHPDGERLLVFAENRSLAWVLDTQSWKSLHELTVAGGNGSNMTCMAWDSGGDRLAIGTSQGSIEVWETTNWSLDQTIRVHDQFVTEVSWSPGDSHLASASRDGSAQISDPRTGRRDRQLRGHRLIVEYVSWNPQGTRLASCSADATLRLWSAEERSASWVESPRDSAWVSSPKCSWSPDGRRFAADIGREIQLRQFDEGRMTQLDGDLRGAWCVWDPTGRYVAAAQDTGVAVYDWESRGMVRRIELGEFPAYGVYIDWNDADPSLLAVGNGTTVWLVDIDEEPAARKLWDDGDFLIGLEWSPDGRVLLTFDQFSTWLIDLPSESRTRGPDFTSIRIQGGTWSPDGSRIAFTLEDLSVRVLRAPDWQEELDLRAHLNQVRWTAWSPKGSRLASGSRDGTVKIWEATSGQLAASLRVGSPVHYVEWSPSGEQLAAMAFDTSIWVWDALAGR